MTSLSPARKRFLIAAKVLLIGGILGYLTRQILAEDGLARLIHEPKQWGYLVLAQVLLAVAFSCSFIRWFLLVRGLQLNFCLADAFRLGSLGFLLNQVAPGSVGGDLVKAVFIAREQPTKRTEAVATVLIDRVIGLYAMLVLASLAMSYADYGGVAPPVIRTMEMVVWMALLLGTAGLFFVLSPLATSATTHRLAARVPLAGPTLTRLMDALEVYRNRRAYLLGAFALALVTHGLLVTSFWCISQGLPVAGPTFLQNTCIAIVAMVAGAVPGMPGGLGVLEGTLAFLYTVIGSSQADGAIVAFAYRAMTYVAAALGACYYFFARQQVASLLQDAEDLAEEMA